MNPVLAAGGLYILGCTLSALGGMSRHAARAGFWAMVLGFGVQTAYVMYRGLAMSRLPLVGVHDTLGFLSVSTVAFGLAVHWHVRLGPRFFAMMGGLVAAFTLAALTQEPHTRPLVPVLRTYWFELHVALSFLSYGLFAVAALLGVEYLLTGDGTLERLQYKSAFMGYAFFSLSMLFGGVWAYLAWGTYWLWTPKELWTVMVWFFYGMYLHARLTGWWTGRPAAVLCMFGYAVVMFTYLGVGLLMKSSHSF